ncbi:pilus assembly protein TadG-related protein [Burkholderia guangdongensis]|uniref:pilus assembly protein TadG-related protein n=1 Tax=Burkholderia guangdongensis TaxID=1792500 RepID=UPI0015C7BA1C|nr:pilus assembly protein TadG-related protein [Burkholderia guangdongensis]
MKSRPNIGMPKSAVGAQRRQRGAVAVMTALFMAVLLAIAAFVIDIGRAYVVRNELQNAADAAALAGAECLNPNSACGNATASGPDFTTAATKATAYIPENSAVNVALQTGQVTTGGWNPASPAGGVTAAPVTLSASQLPAVSVTISEAGKDNNGPLTLLFGQFVGKTTLPISATAVATGGYIAQGHGFPMVINECLYNKLSQLWDSTNNAPLNVPASQDGQTLSSINPTLWGTDQNFPQIKNLPYIIQINSSYNNTSSTGCNAGQWTEMIYDTSDNGGANLIKNYVSGTTATPPVSIGSSIFIDDGKKDSAFGTTDACSEYDGTGTCGYELFPIINQQPIPTGTNATVVGFACLEIFSAQQGNSVKSKNPYFGKGGTYTYPSGSYVAVQLVANSANKCPTGGVGLNPGYGTYGPVRLVQ